MKWIIKNNIVALFVLLAAAVGVVGLYDERVAAQEQPTEPQVQVEQPAPAQPEQPAQPQPEQQQQQPAPAPAEAAYNYVAQSGDSYTLMARKAVQTYGLTSQTNLSQAQIIFAETNLTQEAGSPYLDVSQNVSIREATVKGWVDKAGQLNDQQKAAWEEYVAGTDFNTNNVGQAPAQQ